MGGAGFQTAVVRMWWEQLDEAVAGFTALRSRAELIGDESSIPYTDVLLAQAECLRGDLTAAAAYASEAVARAEQAGQETLAAYGLALRALAAAYAGEESSHARRHGKRSSERGARPAAPQSSSRRRRSGCSSSRSSVTPRRSRRSRRSSRSRASTRCASPA